MLRHAGSGADVRIEIGIALHVGAGRNLALDQIGLRRRGVDVARRAQSAPQRDEIVGLGEAVVLDARLGARIRRTQRSHGRATSDAAAPRPS